MGLFDRFKKKAESAKPAKPADIEVATSADSVSAPVAGKLVAMEDIPDPVFASGAMGKAVGIWPNEGVVYAPVSGSITAGMPHAVGFMSDDDVEVLIHVGIDTVEMKGDGFRMFVERGQHVKAGQVLMTFDRDKIAKAGYKDIVITVITNSDSFSSVDTHEPGEVQAGQQVFKLTK
ncbi:MAG: PTS glucose transporter subunit IIA [Coriobacteriales bacterium]|nr:PTS glucose transporter subunit IIA [Coriobacteriales bacterium]